MAAEAILQIIWKHRLYCRKSLRTTCGQPLEVLNPGEQNFHAGPDFTDARIRLGPLIWAGNVEIHVHASHWNIHGHNLDPSYDNVILHVVLHHDMEVKNSRGSYVPTLKIHPFLTPGSNPVGITLSENCIHCHAYIRDIGPQALKTWYTDLYRERLNLKVRHMTHLLRRYPKDREKALFVALASGFGLPINRLPFEMMANGIPLSLLEDIKDCLPNLEALLFGQSGLLHNSLDAGPYTTSLLKRFARLKKAGNLHPISSHLWKFLRIRPASFPTLRLSQFASLIHLHFPFYGKLMKYKSFWGIRQWLDLRSSSFWNTHYTFKNPSPPSIKRMGQQGILNLSINVLVPFFEATQGFDPVCQDQMDSEKFLQRLPAETNHIIKKWISFGVYPDNAFESQALIQLYQEYCKQKRCVDCEIGKLKPG